MQGRITPESSLHDYDPRHYRFERSAGPLKIAKPYSFLRDALPLLLGGTSLLIAVVVVLVVLLP